MKGKYTLIFSILICLIISLPATAETKSFSFNQKEYLLKCTKEPNPRSINLTPAQFLKLQADPQVEYLEPNFTYVSAFAPNDFYYSNQWYIKRIRADKLWATFNSSPDIVIAVIDTGVQINHPDLKNNIWTNTKEIPDNKIDDDKNGYIDDVHGWDFVNNTADPNPKFKVGYTADGIVHGTVVAGVLGASGNNNAGTAGITWQTQIMPLKALDDRGVTDTVKVINAINYAIKQKVNIINLSFIGPNYSAGLQDAIKRAYQAGIIIVAAGGNDLGKGFGQSLSDRPMYPVCLDGAKGENMIIGVAATDAVDKKATFSGYGDCIDISAPGISIFNTTVYAPERNKEKITFNDYYDGYWSGTSLAVPIVSGVLALLQQANPSLKPKQITDILLNSSDKTSLVNDPYADRIGRGRLNAYTAISQAFSKLNETSTNLIVSENNGTIHKISFGGTDTKISKLAIGSEKNWQLSLSNTNINKYVTTSKNKIKIFDNNGKLIREWLAFENNHIMNLSFAVGDTNNDGKDEIITAIKDKGYSSEIKIYSDQGKLLSKFLAYQKNFKGGVNLAVGDIDNNGTPQIITVPASSGSAQIKIFAGSGRLLSQFMAEDVKKRGNFQIAVTNTYSSIKTEQRIIFYYDDGSSSYIKIYNKDGILRRRISITDPQKPENFLLTTADLNNDGRAEINCLLPTTEGWIIKTYHINGFLINTIKINNKDLTTINNLSSIKLSN